MNRIRLMVPLLAVILALSCMDRGPIRSETAPGIETDPPAYVPGEILVKFKEEVSEARIDEINRRMGGEVVRYIATIRVYHLRFDGDDNMVRRIEKYVQLPEVEYAEPNYKVRAFPENPD